MSGRCKVEEGAIQSTAGSKSRSQSPITLMLFHLAARTRACRKSGASPTELSLQFQEEPTVSHNSLSQIVPQEETFMEYRERVVARYNITHAEVQLLLCHLSKSYLRTILNCKVIYVYSFHCTFLAILTETSKHCGRYKSVPTLCPSAFPKKMVSSWLTSG